MNLLKENSVPAFLSQNKCTDDEGGWGCGYADDK